VAPRKLRVLFCLDSFEGPSTGGTESQFWTLVSLLPRERCEVALVLLRPSRYLRENPPDFPVIELGVGSMLSPLAWWRLARLAWRARRQKFCVAHMFLNDVSICLPPFLKLAGLRVIVSRRDLGFWYTPNILRALRIARRFVDRVIVNCNAVADVTVREERYPRERIDVVFNAHTRAHAPATVVAAGVGASIVLVANLKPIKRIEDAILALSLVRAQGHDARLTLVGKEERSAAGAAYRTQLVSLAGELGVADHVMFAGSVADPSPLIAAADVCLLCSESEGLSNAIIEYLFAGRAVVSTDVGGARDLIEHGGNGLLVTKGDVAGLAAALSTLLNDAELRARMGEHARRSALEKFTAAAMLAAHERIYRRLCGMPDSPMGAT
jgi:glycosyltransferase involved in cell wall biosynthesis